MLSPVLLPASPVPLASILARWWRGSHGACCVHASASSTFPVPPAHFPCLSFPYRVSRLPVVFGGMGRVAGRGRSGGVVIVRSMLLKAPNPQ